MQEINGKKKKMKWDWPDGDDDSEDQQTTNVSNHFWQLETNITASEQQVTNFGRMSSKRRRNWKVLGRGGYSYYSGFRNTRLNLHSMRKPKRKWTQRSSGRCSYKAAVTSSFQWHNSTTRYNTHKNQLIQKQVNKLKDSKMQQNKQKESTTKKMTRN